MVDCVPQSYTCETILTIFEIVAEVAIGAAYGICEVVAIVYAVAVGAFVAKFERSSVAAVDGIF